MSLDFDIENVVVTEFGVGLNNGNEQSFVMVPVDGYVQGVLREMVQATWKAIQNDEDWPAKYDPSEKYGSTESLYLPLEDDMASTLRELHEAANLEIKSNTLNNPSNVFCYFTRMGDNQKRRLTALRRASQFKGILKCKNRLLRMVDDTLKIIEDEVFKLDNDFDLIIDSTYVHIWRPAGFEFVGKLQDAILAVVPENIAKIRKDLPFVEFDAIEAYVNGHPRAARYLASILSQKETKNVDKTLFQEFCKRTGVEIAEKEGKINVKEEHVMGFLEVLDRRRYEISLVREKPELYRAASRRKISN